MVETIEQPKIRFLHCQECGSIETFPFYDGPVERDTTLVYVLTPHAGHSVKVYDIEERAWELPNVRARLIKQLKGGGSLGVAELDPHFYDTRDTLREDAGKCYQAHQRPREGCLDWRIDKKLLVPPTKAERKEIGLSMAGAPRRYLCDFCVVRAYYERKARGD